jgi:acyl-coenzyme A thioesterase PaaI-like protein
MFDLAIGCTGALIDPTRRVATIQLSMRFERPTTGKSIRVEARIDRAATNVIFASAVCYDASDAICGRCQGMVARSDKPWIQGDGPALV